MNWSPAGQTIPSWKRMGVFPAVWGPAGAFYWPGRGALRGPSGWLARGCFQHVARAGLHYARAFLLGGLRRQLEPSHMTWAPSAYREHSGFFQPYEVPLGINPARVSECCIQHLETLSSICWIRTGQHAGDCGLWAVTTKRRRKVSNTKQHVSSE